MWSRRRGCTDASVLSNEAGCLMVTLEAALEKESRYVREIVPQILPILVVHAQNSRILTYKDLALQIDELRRVRHLDKPLDAIGIFVQSASRVERPVPPLNAIVVSRKTCLPGPGADPLLLEFLKKKGIVHTRREFLSNRAEYVRYIHSEIFSFDWDKIFRGSVMLNSKLAGGRDRGTTTRSPIDPGVSGTHFRSGGSFRGSHNPVVLALLESLPRGWKLEDRANSHCDLVVSRGSVGRRIFEVKCGVSTQDLCSALGELVFHTEMNKPAKGIIVIPGNLPLPKEWTRIFQDHRLPLVSYLSRPEGFEFQGLATALGSK
jgi:hypothetical protein